MKKWFTGVLALLVLWALPACRGRNLDWIVENEPSIAGVVQEVSEASILIGNESGEYCVPLDVENGDSVTHFSVGDEVVVYYDGLIAETSPAQISTVYAITLRTPADRAENDRP